jgi:hypothetical protein
MTSEFSKKINNYLEKLEFTKAIKFAEKQLKSIHTTDFHDILGKSLIPQAHNLTQWIDDFYKNTSNKIDIQAMYFEMNEFDINTEKWYIDGIAYEKDGGLALDDMDWLSKCGVDTMTSTEFILMEFEKLQNAFETIEAIEEDNEWTDEMEDARDWSEQLIIARFMELMRAAHLIAKQKGMAWATIPIYFTEHSYDFIVKSN